ncbi:antitoxin [bacterium]|nr:antitoxin [bacterium]
MKLDKFEQDVENNILDYKKISTKNELKINTIIKNAKEKKSINLRVNSYDLYLLKQKADQEGIPYQTLISSILHKYLTDQLIDQKNILKSVQLLKYSS